ncbi:Polygalacturonase inhibitor 1 [Nymphaea thermarum]|nr:Polygalacturonase inhibitor 1 [Nymphaea thermarum]
MSSFIELIFTFFLFLTLSSSTTAYRWRCVPEDRQILQDINRELNNTMSNGWLPDDDCCQHYHGVSCDFDTSRVNAIAFNGIPIPRIPPSLARVPYLKQLFITKVPGLTGEIPEFLSNLTGLTWLEISWTNVTGPVPRWLHRLPQLESLVLNYNRLSGTIPPYLFDLPNLNWLRLDRNQLTGSIPEAFGRFKGNSIFLAHNILTGPVPKSLAHTDWSQIELQWNRLIGDPSPLFNNRSKTLWQLDLSRNLFDFDLTAVQIPVDKLYRFDLSHNIIRGSIPKELVNATSLGIFNVSYNRLCGMIPYAGQLLQFDNTTFFHNRCLSLKDTVDRIADESVVGVLL